MNEFERGFREELAKIALDAYPSLLEGAIEQMPDYGASALMAAPEPARSLLTPERVQALGKAGLGIAGAMLAPTPPGHVYPGFTPESDVSGFRY